MIVENMGDVSVSGEPSGDKSKLGGECEAVLVDENLREWRRLVNQLSRDIPKRLLEWKPKAEAVWHRDSGELDAVRLEAVEICLPSIVPILVSIEKERNDFWEQAIGPLRQLALLRGQMGAGAVAAIEIGSHMLYIAGSLGMAIATETRQLDFVSRWMQLRMPATLYGADTEKPWAEIKDAHSWWGKYLPCAPDPFKDFWQVCQSDYLSGFFTDKRLTEKHLFLANLAQSLYELGRCTQDSKRLEALRAGGVQSLAPSDLKVWPVWTLMKPEDFKSAAWDLFGTSAGVFEFVSPQAGISLDDFWGLWKRWKSICVIPMESHALQTRGPLPQAEWLMLPGEPHGLSR